MMVSNIVMNKNGRLLLAALAMLTTESRTNQTPDEVLQYVELIAEKMFKDDALNMLTVEEKEISSLLPGVDIASVAYKDRLEKLTPIFALIVAERLRQHGKWGEQTHAGFVWAAILAEEVGEVNKALLEQFNANSANTVEYWHTYLNDLLKLRDELVQVAAVACAWIELLDARELPNTKLIIAQHIEAGSIVRKMADGKS